MNRFSKLNLLLFTVVSLVPSTVLHAQVSGTGTPGTVPQFTGTSAIGNSPLIINGSNVGIGTASAQATLEVNGNGLLDWVSGDSTIFLGDTNHGIKSTAGSGITLFTYQVPKGIFLQQNTGYVGIGTNTPTALLHLQSSAQGFLSAAKIINSTYADDGSTGIHLDFVNDSNLDNVGAKVQLVRVGSYGQSDLAFFTKNVASAGDNSTEKMRLASNGNVGIGAVAPGEKLEVSGNIKLTTGTGSHIVFSDSTQQSTAWTGVLSGGDYAESVDVTGERTTFEPGDLLVIDPKQHGHFQKASTPYSRLVGGVYATKPGVTGRRQPRSKSQDEEVPMAMVGIVPTKVSTENGPIHDGDLLVSSSTPGYAMKGTSSRRLTGAVLGKALGTLESGKGIIEVLISLQ